MVESYRLAHGMRATVLRPFSVYGPRQSAGGVVAAIVRQVLRGDVVELADLDARARLLLRRRRGRGDARAATAPPASAGDATLNVASGDGVSIGELARAAVTAAGRELPIRVRDRSDRPRAADIRALVADTTCIRASLGWAPRVNLVDGLRRTIEWFRTTEDA